MKAISPTNHVDRRTGQGNGSDFQSRGCHIVFDRFQAQSLPANESLITVSETKIQRSNLTGTAEGAGERILLLVKIQVSVHAQAAIPDIQIRRLVDIGAELGQNNVRTGNPCFQGKRCRCSLAVDHHAAPTAQGSVSLVIDRFFKLVGKLVNADAQVCQGQVGAGSWLLIPPVHGTVAQLHTGDGPAERHISVRRIVCRFFVGLVTEGFEQVDRPVRIAMEREVHTIGIQGTGRDVAAVQAKTDIAHTNSVCGQQLVIMTRQTKAKVIDIELSIRGSQEQLVGRLQLVSRAQRHSAIAKLVRKVRFEEVLECGVGHPSQLDKAPRINRSNAEIPFPFDGLAANCGQQVIIALGVFPGPGGQIIEGQIQWCHPEIFLRLLAEVPE